MDQIAPQPVKKHMLQALLPTLLGLLSVEFIFGMISNLYVEFPATTDQQQLMDATWKHWPTATHAILGVIILIIGFLVLVQGIRSKRRILSALGAVGFAALVTAALGGDRFVRTQHEAWSMVMAVGFIVAMGVYGRLMAVASKPSA